jgi:preprotein translocase subunit SecE
LVAGSIPAAPANLVLTFILIGSTTMGCEEMAVQEMTVQGTTARWKKFFREVRAELKKVSWPNRKELASYTGVVFVSVIIVAVMIWLIDTAFTEALRAFLK